MIMCDLSCEWCSLSLLGCGRVGVLIFFFKQKTAYEMRISDWSSDVCSSDLKMGIHANATCVMNYDGATGWLVGDENKGLAAMFVMMNAARLGVGIQGLGQADIAWQKDRKSTRLNSSH